VNEASRRGTGYNNPVISFHLIQKEIHQQVSFLFLCNISTMNIDDSTRRHQHQMSSPPSQLGPVDVRPQASLEGIKLQDFSIEIKYPHKHEDDNRDVDEDKMKAEDVQKQLDA
jgi:hypothetical protein